MQKLVIGRIYIHYKGHKVKVIGQGRHSETREWMVIYEKLEDGDGYKKGDVWIRSREMFLENVTKDGKTFSRFKLVE